MKILQIDNVKQSKTAPNGWVQASDNGWGYLTLMGLQESGLLAKVTRVPRNALESYARAIIDESISSYVEDTDELGYATNFLQWQWYFQAPSGSTNFWAEFSSEVYSRIFSEAPLPEENYQAILGLIRWKYRADMDS